MESWKEIKGYEGLYMVSTYGNVKRLATTFKDKLGRKWSNKEKILRVRLTRGGYCRVSLSKDGIAKDKYIHRLVAETFIPNVLDKEEINHIDGNKLNNKADNLEWVTRQENEKHKVKMGLYNSTDKHKEQCRENQKRSVEANLKPILQLSLEGKIVNRFISVKEAKEKTGIVNCGACARGSRKTAGGYLWEYEK